MSKKIDRKREDRENKRRDALVRALEYELAEALDLGGITLLGFAVKYDAFECLLTLKGMIADKRSVAFVGSDSAMNAILKAVSAANYDRLRWKEDIYKPSSH